MNFSKRVKPDMMKGEFIINARHNLTVNKAVHFNVPAFPFPTRTVRV